DGAIFGAIGGGAFLGLGRLAPANIRLLPGVAAMFGVSEASGVVGGVAASLAHGERPTLDSVQKAALASLFGGLGSVHRGAKPSLTEDATAAEALDARTVGAVTDGTVHLEGGLQPHEGGLPHIRDGGPNPLASAIDRSVPDGVDRLAADPRSVSGIGPSIATV